jgi:hypothetical protein
MTGNENTGVRLAGTLAMHLEVGSSAMCKDFRAAWSEIGESSDELLWGRCGCLMEVNGGYEKLRSITLFVRCRTPSARCTCS